MSCNCIQSKLFLSFVMEILSQIENKKNPLPFFLGLKEKNTKLANFAFVFLLSATSVLLFEIV